MSIRHRSICHSTHLSILCLIEWSFQILLNFCLCSIFSFFTFFQLLLQSLNLTVCSLITSFKLTNSSVDRSHLTSVVVRIVFDLRRFLKSHHRWAREINENTIQLIAAIITFNQSSFLFATDVRITNRVDFESLSYSSKWIINIIRFRENIQIFRNVTFVYRTFETFRNFLQLKHFNSISSSNFSSNVSSSESSRRFETSRNSRFRNVLKNSNQQSSIFTTDISRFSKESTFVSFFDLVNNLNTRKTFAKEIIYSLSIESNLLVISMNSNLQTAIIAVVSAAVTQTINDIKIEIRQKLQQA